MVWLFPSHAQESNRLPISALRFPQSPS